MGLKISDDFVTVYDELVLTPRTTKYAAEQKSRRTRIGFEAPRAYAAKTNRHFHAVGDTTVARALAAAAQSLANAPAEIKELNVAIMDVLDHPGTKTREEELRSLCSRLP